MGRFMMNEVRRSFEFAKAMRGNHRPDFQGGPGRDEREIFINDIQGKLAEIAVRKELLRTDPGLSIEGEIDFNVYGRGKWDNYDLVVNGKFLSVKSIKSFSVVLMIECSRFDVNGLPAYQNNNGEDIINDFYILVKIKIEPNITWNDANGDFNNFKNPILNRTDEQIRRHINYDVAGFISHDNFWDKKLYIPKGTIITARNMTEYLLNGQELNELPDSYGEGMKVDNYAVHSNTLTALTDFKL